MSEDLAKEVTVVCGTGRRTVNVNFGNHEETLDAIRRKWRLTEETQFELQAYCGEKGTYFDIVDIDDLKRHKNAEELIVRISQSSAMPGQMSPGHQPSTSINDPIPPPSYEQSRQPQRTKITVHCGLKKKQISVDTGSFDAVHGTVKQRFSVTKDFQLQVQDDEGERIDIDCNDDLEDNAEYLKTMWAVEITPQTEPKVIVSVGGRTKHLTLDKTNFESIQETIQRRFNLELDFKLHVENSSGKRIDIENDDDLRENKDLLHSIWVSVVEKMLEEPTKPEDESLAVVAMKDGGSYSIIEAPKAESQIVKDVVVQMRDNVSIPLLSTKLEQIADCLQIGYYASTDYKDMKNYVTDLQLDVQKLCQICDKTMLVMQTKAGDALNELLCGFGYMLDGFEDFGLERIGNVGEIAGKIKDAVDEIQKEALCPDVVKGMRGIVGTKEKEAAEIQRKHDEMEMKEEQIRRERQSAESHVGSLRSRETSAQWEERRHLKSDSGFGFGLKKVFSFGCYQGSTKLAEQEKRIAEDARRERREEEERVRELKEKEMAADIELQATAEKLAETMDDLEKMTQEALNGAEAGMKPLNSILETMSHFWALNQKEFESIGNTAAFDNLRKMFANENVSDARRKQFWTGKAFKKEALQSIARLAAVQSMCMDFRKKMVPVLENMYRVIADNPTPEEAKAKLPDLIAKYNNRMKQDAIEESKHEENLAIVGRRYAQDEDEQEDQGEDERKDEDFDVEAIIKDAAADAE